MDSDLVSFLKKIFRDGIYKSYGCICQLFLLKVLEKYEPAYTNFQAMSMSVKKTYTRAYFDAKTDAGREKRIAWMVDRLNQNLKPM